MENCININHPDVIKLSSELKLPPIVVAAKIGIWQEDNNNYEEFPTKEELLKVSEYNDNVEIIENEQFKDLQELKSKPEFKEGIEFVFNNTPELQDAIYESLGSTQKQQALDTYAGYIAKISLGIIKNPTTGEYNDSLSTDIWYHGTNANPENVEYLKPSQSGTYGPGIYLQSKQGHYFTGTFGKNTISVIADIKKTYDFKQDGTEFYNALRKEHGQEINDKLTNILQNKLLTEGYDSLIDIVKDDINFKYLLILRSPDLSPSSKKLHILGSESDINGFKEFIKNNSENEELTTNNKSSLSVNLNNQNQIPYIEDTTLKYRLFNGKETSNAFSVLENISFQNSPLSFLAKELLNNSKIKDLKNITIKLISRNDDIYRELSKIVSNKKYDNNYKVKSFAGIILYDENTIYITKERFDFKYETAIIHEILHALTHEKINTNVLYKNEWNDVYNYVYQTLVKNNINPNDWYPMVNPDELLTGIFTNAQFIKMLSTIKSNDKSLYDYIIDFFKKLLNITNISLLDEVMTQGLKMLNDLPIDEKYYSSNTRNFKQSYTDFNEMIEAAKPNLILTEQVLDAIPNDPVIKYINGNVDDYIDLYNSQEYKPTEYPYIRYNYIIDDVKKYIPNPINVDKRVYKSTEFNKLLNKVESINKEQGYNAFKIIERIDGNYLITDNQNSNEIENIKKDLLKSLYKKDDYGLNVPWYYYAKEIIDKNVVFKHKDIYFSLDKDAFIYMLQNNIDPEYTSLIKENFANTLEIPNTNFNLLSDIVKTDNNIYLKIKNNEPVYIPNYNGLSIIKDVPMLFYKKGNNININKEGKPVLIDTKNIEIDKNGVVISDKLPIIELDINANDTILKESNKTYKDYYIDNIFKNFNISNYLTIEEAEELRNKILLKLKRDNQKYDVEFTKNKEYNKIIMTMSDDNTINISLNFNPITIKKLENMDIIIYDLKPEYLKSLYELTTNELNNDLTCSI